MKRIIARGNLVKWFHESLCQGGFDYLSMIQIIVMSKAAKQNLFNCNPSIY